MAKKSADAWFAEYGESHQNHTNEIIHWICVPVIFWSVLALLWSVPVPAAWLAAAPWFNWSIVAMVIALAFYVRLSPPLSAGMLCFMSLCYLLLVLFQRFVPWPVWRIALIAFVIAWGRPVHRSQDRGSEAVVPQGRLLPSHRPRVADELHLQEGRAAVLKPTRLL